MTRSTILVPPFLALLLAGAAFLTGEFGPGTKRPSSTATTQLPPLRAPGPLQRVPLRLWEDPLADAYVDALRPASAFGQPREEADVARRLRAAGRPPKLLVMLVRGGTQDEDRETRLRIRDAMHSALGAVRETEVLVGDGVRLPAVHDAYAPVDSEHIGYVRAAPPGARIDEEWSEGAITVRATASADALRVTPFEQFATADSPDCNAPPSSERIVVLWVDEESLGPEPLAGITTILEPWIGAAGGVPPVLVGPTSSGVLKEMIHEAARHACDPQPAPWARWVWYSPWATVHLERRGPAPDPTQEPPRLEGDWLAEALPNVHRTIGEDLDLVRALHDELHLRRIEPREVLLLVEWDTPYGRGLYDLFRAEAARRTPALASDGPTGPFGDFFRYARGLDGVTPLLAGARSGSAESGAPATPMAEGRSRLDAISRLRAKLAGRRPPVQAVGILGTDVYDKLLLLREVKRVCPGALFFTTDLDARMLDPADRAMTRNLVVASHYGLELGPSLQPNVLPFRSGYQAAAYASITWALATLAEPGFRAPAPPLPHVYELCRVGAFDLGSNVRPGTRAATDTWSHPVVARRGMRWPCIPISLVALLLLVLAVRSWRVTRRGPGTPPPVAPFAWGTGAGLLVVGGVGVGDAFLHAGGEPFAFAQYLSVWPTCLLRVLLFGLSCYYLASVRRTLDRTAAEQDRLFPTVPVAPEAEAGAGAAHAGPVTWWRRGGGWLRRLSPIARTPDELGGSAAAVWADTRDRGRAAPMRIRIHTLTVLYLGSIALLFLLFGWPRPPIRGTLSFAVHAVTLWLDLYVLVLLNVMVFDAAVGHAALLNAFTAWDPQWEEEQRERTGRGLGVPPAAAEAWLAHTLLKTRGDVVDKFVYFPFIALLIMIVIHHPVFDDFTIPPSMLFVYGLCFAFALLAGVFLAHGAARARRHAVERVEAAFEALPAPERGARTSAVERLRQRIQGEPTSGLARLLDNPTLRALLIPSGGFGVMTLLHSLLSGS